MPPPDDVADLRSVRALANPLRQRILRELRTVGEATATALAGRLGVTSGGTSYNLRVLAEAGLVTEVPERARGRERWWRAADRDLRFAPRSEQDPAFREAIGELHRLWIAEDLETFARFQLGRENEGPWSDAVPYSRGEIQVTLDELRSFFEDYLALLRRYQRSPAGTPADARSVLTRFLAFPEPIDSREGDPST
ncbi:ArsR/SmtB family transcription factor [Cryptosporangium sp. NPDC048952]|uniref:ArsR/SmtB family transcription factor n=1 Tax=Cryptosporangium sp. NPDC048952 TaxID=3363961 RepID=UPI0037237D62